MNVLPLLMRGQSDFHQLSNIQSFQTVNGQVPQH